MRLVIRPVQDPQREIDLTHRLTATIAEELWSLYGGNEQLNWVEAELHLQRLVESVRGQVNGEAIEKARAEALDEARRESDLTRERLFVMVTRMDGQGDANGLPSDERVKPRPAMDHNGERRDPSPGARTRPRRGSEVSKGLRQGSRGKDKVGAV
ncbi:hypothetical protein PHYC_00537 [Phycisphaerales bacterium]|nr:hypothetical protein PHYC_00537 [Phycisphaerales bacterium]